MIDDVAIVSLVVLYLLFLYVRGRFVVIVVVLFVRLWLFPHMGVASPGTIVHAIGVKVVGIIPGWYFPSQ